jgi:hypothetical protein
MKTNSPFGMMNHRAQIEFFNIRNINMSHYRKTTIAIAIAAVVAWIIGALASLAVTGAIIYVAWHFLCKFW